MARRRLQAILVSATLAVGILTTPAVAADLGPVSADLDATEQTLSAEVDGDTATEPLDTTLDAPTVSATLEPSGAPTVETDDDPLLDDADTGPVEEAVDTVTDTVEDIVDTTSEQLPSDEPSTKPAGEDDVAPADEPTPSATRRPAAPAQAAAPDTRPASGISFDRAQLSRGPARPTVTAAASHAADQAVVEPAPQVAPPRADEATQLVAQADTGPLPASVPALLKILATVMVAGAAGTWLHVNREVRSWAVTR